MDKRTGTAHLRLLGFKLASQYSMYMKHPGHGMKIYFDSQTKIWRAGYMHVNTESTNILEVLNG